MDRSVHCGMRSPLYLVFLGWGAGPRFSLVLEIFHLKISSCPFWDTCTYEGLKINFDIFSTFINKRILLIRRNKYNINDSISYKSILNS